MAATTIKNGFQGGSDDQLKINPDGSINVNGGGSGGSNASVSATGTQAPTYATEIAGINPSGHLVGVNVDAAGNLLVNGNISGSTNSTPVPAGPTVLTYGTNTVVVGATNTIVTYTTPNNTYIQCVYMSGTSIGTFVVLKNSNPLLVMRGSQTSYSSVLNLSNAAAFGLKCTSGDVISVQATNNGTSIGTFDVTIQSMTAL